MPKPSSLYTFDALGTRWSIELLQRRWKTAVKKRVLQEVTEFETAYTRFRDDSLIGQLNITKRLPSPPQELVDMLVFAEKMHAASQGAFNISVAGALQKAGYGKASGRGRPMRNFWNEVKYNRDEIVIPGETIIDLGGFGKGWLIDKLGVILEQLGLPYHVINGGGDILVSAPAAIELGLEHPYEPDKGIGTTKVKRGALAVSSVVKRRWQKDGQTHHHIIDPETTASSANDVVSTYVKAPSALIADTCATVLLLRPELAEKFEQQFGLKTIILTRDQLESMLE